MFVAFTQPHVAWVARRGNSVDLGKWMVGLRMDSSWVITSGGGVIAGRTDDKEKWR